MTLKLDMHYCVLMLYQICYRGDLWMTLTFFLHQGQIWSLRLLYGEKGKTVDLCEAIVAYGM